MREPQTRKILGFQIFISFILSDVQKFAKFNGEIVFQIRPKWRRYRQKTGFNGAYEKHCNAYNSSVCVCVCVCVCVVRNGVGTNFGVGVGEARPEGPRAGDGVLGEGQPAHQIGGLRERCKLPQRGPGRSPGRRRVFLYSEPSDCLSQHLSTCCILQFGWIFSRGISISPT